MRVRTLATVLVASLLLLGLVAGCGKSSNNSNNSNATTPSVAAASGGSGNCPTTETMSGAKTKFVLHAGLAVGAFHHWIWDPFRAGSFSGGGLHRLTAIAKAALAAAFVVHELGVAKSDAAADPTLCKVVVAPIDGVRSAFSAAVSRIRGGSASSNDLNPIESTFTTLKAQASNAGSPFNDQIPSTSQLANPSSTGS